MRNSHRIIAALVCAIALLALPAYAAPTGGGTSPAPTSIDQLGSWLGSLWHGLVEMIVGPASPPAPSPPSFLDFGDGGSCIDPNGCLQQH